MKIRPKGTRPTRKHVFSSVSALLAIALAVSACDSNDSWGGGGSWSSLESCSDFTTCNSCTAALGCGWCFQSDGSGVCGDDANNCATEWTWEASYCRAPADASVSTTSSDASSPRTTTDDAGNDSGADAASDAAGD